MFVVVFVEMGDFREAWVRGPFADVDTARAYAESTGAAEADAYADDEADIEYMVQTVVEP